MKRVTTLFLKGTVCLIGMGILALLIFVVPLIAEEFAKYFPAYMLYPVIIGMYMTALPFFFALFQALKLLSYIDKNMAFSDSSVKALKNVKWSAFSISIVYVVLLPFLYLLAEYDDAPGFIVIGLVFIFASFVIAVFAAVLQMLLKSAIDIKIENDLTV